MRKFLLGAFVGVLLTVVLLAVVIAVIVKLGSGKKTTITSNSVLVFNPDGDLPEVAPVDVDLPLIQNQTEPTIRDIWTSLHAAASDPRIKGIVFKPRSLSLGWAKLQEIREELIDFKKSGKPVYAYLQTPGMHEYFLASVADRIYVSPDDYLQLKGFRVESTYFKGTLDKLGISFDVDHIGKYKDAGDMLTRTSMTPESREVMGQVLDQIYGSFCTDVAEGRHKTAGEIQALIDKGPFLAAAAKDAGLVDELGYESQLYRDLTDRVKVNGEVAKLSYKTYARATPGSGARIALLSGEGDIIRGNLDQPFGQAQVIASETFSKTVQQVRKDKSVKGVILRVNSPGGDAVASDEILHELRLLAAEKPLVISMSDLAASGGYFISMTGDPIVAYPDTITGSIGVIYGKPNFRGLYEKLGITKEMLTRGAFADIDSDYKPLSEPEKQKLHEGILSTYHSFVGKVAVARKKTYEQIDPLAQGRVWMGAQASKNGLVDRLGGLNTAVALIRERAKLAANTNVNLVMYPPRRGFLDMILNTNPDTVAEAKVRRSLQTVLGDMPSPALLRGGILQLMPYRITVH